jgi:large subunit ribosomal protein L24
MGKMHVKKGDTVYVLSGKDSGKKGKVLDVDLKERKILVEGINIVTKHVKPRPNKGFQQGGLVHQEAAIHVDKVMLICGKCGLPTKVGRKVLENGNKARVCKKCGEIIDIIGEKKD